MSEKKFKYDIVFYSSSTKVCLSYLYTNEEINQIVDYIIYTRKLIGYSVNRTKKSYIQEINAHNRLAKMGLFLNHTVDTDLEEDIDLFHKIAYAVLGH